MRWGYESLEPPLPSLRLGSAGTGAQLDGAGATTGGVSPGGLAAAADAGSGSTSVVEAPGNGGAAAGGAPGSAGSSGGGSAGTGAGGASTCSWTPFGPPEQLTGFGLTGNLWGPALSSDGLTLYFSSDAGSSEDLYVATRNDRGVVLTPAQPVSELNSTTLDSSPSLSADGLVLHFCSTRTGTVGNRDLMVATRPDPSSPFESPTWLSELNTPGREQNPDLTPDLRTIVFSSDDDLYMAERASENDPFGPAQALAAINSSAADSGAAFSADGLALYFASQRPGGAGNWDIWLSTRPDRTSPFAAPVDVAEVNGSDREFDPELSADGTELLFVSTRSGTAQLWRATRTCR
jgi:Tol biopolymer transport system component